MKSHSVNVSRFPLKISNTLKIIGKNKIIANT